MEAEIFERRGNGGGGPLGDVLSKPSADGGSELGGERASYRRQSALLGVNFETREALDEIEALGELEEERETSKSSTKVVRAGAKDSSRDGGGGTRGGNTGLASTSCMRTDRSTSWGEGPNRASCCANRQVFRYAIVERAALAAGAAAPGKPLAAACEAAP